MGGARWEPVEADGSEAPLDMLELDLTSRGQNVESAEQFLHLEARAFRKIQWPVFDEIRALLAARRSKIVSCKAGRRLYTLAPLEAHLVRRWSRARALARRGRPAPRHRCLPTYQRGGLLDDDCMSSPATGRMLSMRR